MFHKNYCINLTLVIFLMMANMVSLPKAYSEIVIPQSSAVSTEIPDVDGDGFFCELFTGIGGGREPHPDDIQSKTPDATLLSPRINFPNPGNTVGINDSFQNFFSNTIYAPDSVRDLNPQNFILRCSALLKISKEMDNNVSTNEIDISIRIGCDDGHYIMIGGQYLGNSPDHGFTWYAYDLSFENEGLYQLYFLFAANSTGVSGLELQWQIAQNGWSVVPQSHAYYSSERCDQKINFEEYPSSTLLNKEYLNQGIVFNILSGNIQITNAFPNEFVPVSGDQVFGDPNYGPEKEGKLELLFVDPETSQPAVTHYFSCFVIDSESIGAVLTAYNASEEVLTSNKVNSGGASQEKIEFSMPGIRRIEITLGKNEDTSALDNLCWASPTALPMPDLQVTEISMPDKAYSSKDINISWKVTNIGVSTAQGTWKDNIYLSKDSILDSEDILIKTFEHSTPVNPNNNYIHSESCKIPDNLKGEYQVIILADSANDVKKYYHEDNNITVSNHSVSITEFIVDKKAPKILDISPSGKIKQGLNHIDITFDEAILASTFSAEDVVFVNPDGKIIPVDTPVESAEKVWRIYFEPQSEIGRYEVYIGPHISDNAGNELDGNNNNTFGEDSDTYSIMLKMCLAQEQSVLMINVHGSSYDNDGKHIYDTLVKAGANAEFINLSTNTQNGLVQSLSTNIFEQVWVFDLSSSADNYPDAWQAIADWYNANQSMAIICDGRMISSYWKNQYKSEGKFLTENYYENMKLKGGGLLLGTDHNGFHPGINTINTLINIEPFTGNFTLTTIPVDTNNPLMTFPNDLGEYLRDDSTPGQTPYGVQPNGRILYSLAWHSGNHNHPGISSTIEGTVGFHVSIVSPNMNESFYINSNVEFLALTSNATPPITYNWHSNIDGNLGTGSSFQTNQLSVGTHIISLSSEDAAGGADTEEVSITIIDLPDLSINELTWNPETNIESGNEITFYANIINSGNLTITKAFDVDFFIDGISIGKVNINQQLTPDSFIQISKNWTAQSGFHDITIIVDSSNQIFELNENNNHISKKLSEIIDKTPPEDIANIIVQCFEDKLIFNWPASENSEKDLAGYKVYFNTTDANPELLTSGQNTYERKGLTPATEYSIKISAFDNKGNESTGTSTIAATLLDNPNIISAETYNGYVELTWTQVTPASLLKSYNVYVNPENYTHVEAMQPVMNFTGNSGKIAGLQNNVPYYFAVTALNISDGEQKIVQTIRATPSPDKEGPVIEYVKINDRQMDDDFILDQTAYVKVDANDPVNVSGVSFYLDDNLHCIDRNGSDLYSCQLEIYEIVDGQHILSIEAVDTLGNATKQDYTFTVRMKPPETIPQITSPLDGSLVNTKRLTVTGTGEIHSEIDIFVNEKQFNQWIQVDTTGSFSLPITLNEGENQLVAMSRNRAGNGPLSEQVIITLDSSKPDSPPHLTATSKPGGVVQLSWQKPLDTTIKGYFIYRSLSIIQESTKPQAINQIISNQTAYQDMPSSDGLYYYYVTSIDPANNESVLSEPALIKSDSTAPSCHIEYSPDNYDMETGRMGQGNVNLLLTVSEPLQMMPFLSINPPGSIPMFIDLQQISDIEYTGFFTLYENTPSSTTYAVFSARDIAGNRGTDINSGGSIIIDTDGPSVTRLEIDPGTPIQNNSDNPVSISMTIGLNERLKEEQIPQISYMLTGEGREDIKINRISIIEPPLANDTQTLQAIFQLPYNAGKDQTEFLQFSIKSEDKLNNVSDVILCDNYFEIYQGDLPPLDSPANVKGISKPGGIIDLSWDDVNDSSEYLIYRKGPIDEELKQFIRVNNTSFSDNPEADGTYVYVISSVRKANGQEAFSPIETATQIKVVSDSIKPNAPQNLNLTLTGKGIKIEWENPPYTEPITFSIYRANADVITSVTSLTPLVTNIDQTAVIDPTPSYLEHCYVVTSVDQSGNESEPSESFYLNFNLLPVPELKIYLEENQQPKIIWKKVYGDIEGYDIYLNQNQSLMKLNSSRLSGLEYIDTGYSNDERMYTIKAVDVHAEESIGRSILLPQITTVMLNGKELSDFADNWDEIVSYIPDFDDMIQDLPLPRRGIMNRLTYLLKNDSDERMTNVQLLVNMAGFSHVSQKFIFEPGEYKIVPVVVGGNSAIPDLASVITTVKIIPDVNEEIRLVSQDEIYVGDGMFVLGVQNEAFTRGISGKVNFTFENTCDEEIEIVTATHKGRRPSNEISVHLKDSDGNVLSTASYKQTIQPEDSDGSYTIVTLSNGVTVLRIAPKAIFTSNDIEMSVPANSPDDVIVQVNINKIHYHHNRIDHASMPGVKTTHSIALIDTTYYGRLDQVEPYASFNGVHVIKGSAILRKTEHPMPNVRLDLVISVKGFNRTYQVYTNESGSFEYTFTSIKGESGKYYVYCVHPDLRDRKAQGHFIIKRVLVNPTQFNLNIPTNYEKTLSVKVSTGVGTELNNLQLVFEAEDQPNNSFPQGVYVSLDEPVALLKSNSRKYLNIKIRADNTASPNGKLVFRVKSDESNTNGWAQVIVNTQFTPAKPVLYFSPNFIETGVARTERISEKLILQNKGLAAMNDVKLSLVKPDGTAAPAWVHLDVSSDLGTINVGEQKNVMVTFQPPETVAEGYHNFYIRVESPSYKTTDIGMYVAVKQSGEGNVIFKVSNIYTGTLNDNNEIVQGLSGATIKIQHETLTKISKTMKTDKMGEAFFENFPAGSYTCRISASNHRNYSGRFWIKPGVTTNQEIYLKYNLVTVEWKVNEIVIEDKYEIILDMTFETEVPLPAAVVVIEPGSINLPELKKGDVYLGEFKMINYGLIQAQNIQFAIPQGNEFYKLELLSNLPEILPAKESITIPYRVVCLMSPEQEEEGNSTGGGDCRKIVECIDTTYEFEAECGKKDTRTARHCIVYYTGDCSSSSSGTSGSALPPVSSSGGTSNISYSGGGGSVSTAPKPAPPAEQIQGVLCPFEPKCAPGDKCCEIDNTYSVDSTVDLLRGEYLDDATDIYVKVPGFKLEIKRYFYDNNWHFELLSSNLNIVRDYVTNQIKYIMKDRLKYESANRDHSIFIFDQEKIFVKEDGYRWESKDGFWEEFNQVGNLEQYGDPSDVKVNLIYDDNKQLVGITDNFDKQVLWLEYNNNGQIMLIHDAANRKVEYYYVNDKMTTFVDVLGYEMKYTYDASGKLIRKNFPNGKIITIKYNAYDYVSSVKNQDNVGTTFNYSYDEGKNEYYAKALSPSGKITEKWFDSEGDLKKTLVNGREIEKITRDYRNEYHTNESGNTTQYEYDEWDNLTKIIHPDSSTITYEYDPLSNNLTQEINERGVITQYQYNSKSELTRKIEAFGTEDERITEYTYDDYGNRLSIKMLGDERTEESTTIMTYDNIGNMITIADPEGTQISYTYDIMGNVLSKSYTDGTIWFYSYDDAGRLTKVEDPMNHITTFEYDYAGNKTKEVNAKNQVTKYHYDIDNNLIAITDAAGYTIRMEYNSDGMLSKKIDQEGKSISYEFDSEKRLIKTIDGNNNVIEYVYGDYDNSDCSSCNVIGNVAKIIYPTYFKEFRYDSRGRKIKEIDVLIDGTSMKEFEYDDTGNLISEKDKNGNKTYYYYDNLNRLILKRNVLNYETKYKYDDRDNVIELIDANENTTKLKYNKKNQLIKEELPMKQTTSFGYNIQNKIIWKRDAKNQKVEYKYYKSGQLRQKLYYSNADNDLLEKTVTFEFDSIGNLISYTDNKISGYYTYDALNRKLSETVDYEDFKLSYSYTYYKNGMKKSFTDPDNITYNYSYNDNNQINNIVIPEKGNMTFKKYNYNMPSIMYYPGGTKREVQYDQLNRIKTIRVNDPGKNLIMNYQYEYDKMNNIIQKETESGSYSYQYDEINRLTESKDPIFGSKKYTYDSLGNRLVEERLPINFSKTETICYTYNANNELMNYSNVVLSYDKNGALDNKKAKEINHKYYYNGENWLYKVEDVNKGSLVEYYYDPFGRRIWKDVNGKRFYFFYSDEGLVAEIDNEGNIIKTYGYKPASLWSTNPIFLRQNDQYFFFQNDHLGTPISLLSIEGKEVWNAHYSSFGIAIVSKDESLDIQSNLRFPGQIYDQETNLNYNLYRYYDPSLGKYIQRDPLKYYAYDNNSYEYALNNPSKYIDPLGLKAKKIDCDKLYEKCTNDAYDDYHWSLKMVNRLIDWMRKQVEDTYRITNRYCYTSLDKKYHINCSNLAWVWYRKNNSLCTTLEIALRAEILLAYNIRVQVYCAAKLKKCKDGQICEPENFNRKEFITVIDQTGNIRPCLFP